VKTMSLGLITDPDTPVIWRGPMVMKALDQFLTDVKWGQLDFMIIDLPPGTGDAQLTLTQKVPLSGAVVVTTPQDVALIDARKVCDVPQGERAGPRYHREHELLHLPPLR